MKAKPAPLTPRMREALKLLAAGDEMPFAHTHIGRPTKQRLAKYGLAEHLKPKDWDGPMRITEKGLRAF